MSQGRSPAGAAHFFLETDDGTGEERDQSRAVKKKDPLVSALAVGGAQRTTTPMDTRYQPEPEDSTPRIKFNLNFDKLIRGVEETEEERSRRFDLKRLFEAVSCGDVTRLEGLHEYLHKSMKKLTNSEYQPYGKNSLMKALLNLKDGRNDAVEYLLDISEKMKDIKEFVNGAYTHNDYRGQSALHIAIERRNMYYIELLVRKGADVHKKACGKFFQPQDGPSFYFGELPLSLAACTNQPEVVDFLMTNGHRRADMRERDSLGNTVLHALVMVADNSKENTDFVVKTYDHILTGTARLHPKCELRDIEDIENDQGLTPLKLAAKMGKIGLFEHILRREFKDRETCHLSRKFTEWAYGPVHSSLYNLASLDSYEKHSVLEILVYGSGIPNRHAMLEIEPLNRLLEQKWDRFAARIFFLNFLLYLLYLSVFTVVSYKRQHGTPPFAIENTTEGYVRLAGQLLTALASCYFFIRGILDLKRKRPKLQCLLTDGYYEFLFFLQAMLFMASSALYLCGREEYLGLLVLCLALSWVNLLYFSRGSRHMGIYSVMIQKMILSDILRFLFVYSVFLLGFSAAVVTLLVEPAPVSAAPHENGTGKAGRFFVSVTTEEENTCQKVTFMNITYTTLELFKFTIGMGDLEFTQGYRYKEVFYVLLITYIVLTYILLLNMLIALMNRTVERLSSESQSIWKLQRAITILDLEKSLPRCLRTRLRSGVETTLGSLGKFWCFRVEEVNWNKWNTNLGIIHEDPGSGDVDSQSPVHSPPSRDRTWRGMMRNFSRRGLRPQHRHDDAQEMSPLSPV